MPIKKQEKKCGSENCGIMPALKGKQMGCDIHTVAQIKKGDNWKTVKANIGDEDRSYDSFAVLANVRNGYGFAGVETGEGWEPIAEPRGFPEKFYTENEYHEFKNALGDYSRKWMGDHSHSWCTLQELQDKMKTFNGKSYSIVGIVDKATFDKIMNGELDYPDSWCGGISGQGIRVVTQKELAQSTVPLEYTHVQMTWKVPAIMRLFYLRKVVDELWRIKWDYECANAADVRLVFGFDS